MRRLLIIASLTAVALAGAAQAQTYQGYVPQERLERGETWEGRTAGQILNCTPAGYGEADRQLTPAQGRQWLLICYTARKNAATFASRGCGDASRAQDYACLAAITQDNQTRRNPDFWALVDALNDRTPREPTERRVTKPHGGRQGDIISY